MYFYLYHLAALQKQLIANNRIKQHILTRERSGGNNQKDIEGNLMLSHKEPYPRKY